VDLVGSTAFKGGIGETKVNNSVHPMWVDEIGKFYREFPASFRRRFSEQTASPDLSAHSEAVPQIWKTVGDEIIFCCRILCLDHLVCVIQGFTQALEDYGRVLDSRGEHLDVKGTAWIAAFPSPNVTIEIFQGDVAKTVDLPDEELEQRADAAPHKFDFLGKSIDCGFRLAKFSSADKLILSAELTLALCESANSSGFRFRGDFNYHGREELKGVIAGRPYPIVTVDTQRSALRREVFHLERPIVGLPVVTPVALGTFMRKLMEDEGIEPAILVTTGERLTEEQRPKSYSEFRTIWETNATEAEKRRQSEVEAAAAPDLEGDVPQEVEAVLQEIVSSPTN
jgi:hypothetical protein